MVNAFEGNRAETATMLPVIKKFKDAYKLDDVTIVADAGMFSDANRRAIEEQGLSFILGAKIPTVPYVVQAWRDKHPGLDIPDGHVFTQPWPAGRSDRRRDQVIFYQYRADRARRTLRGIDEQIAKAEKAVAGKVPVKRNRFVSLTGGERAVNRALEAKARELAGLKGYVTNLHVTAQFAIDSYHQLWHVEKSFRMSKHDLRARPIYHHTKDSIQAHLTIVFAALAISRLIEARTGWSIKQFVRTARRYRTIQVRVGGQTVTAADPLSDDLQTALSSIREPSGGAH
jgi:transposase